MIPIPSPNAFSPRGFLTACLAGMVFFTLLLGLGGMRIEGDTQALSDEMDPWVVAIEAGKWSGWGGKFPLLQKLPWLGFHYLGLDRNGIHQALVALNAMALGFMVWLGFGYFKASIGPRTPWIWAMFLLGGPFLAYGRSSFGELLGAFWTTWFIWLILKKARTPWVMFAFMLAGLSKDTAPPFLLLLGGAAYLFVHGRQARNELVRGALGLGAAFVLSMAVQVGMNLLRFGTILNASYRDEVALGPVGLADPLSSSLAMWVSPNGGLLVFSPMFLVILLAAGWAALGRRRAGGKPGSAMVLAAVAAVLLVLTLGFGKWFSPLGWIAWGPRLLLPWIPAVALLLLAAGGETLEGWLGRLAAKPWLAALLLVAWGAFAFPHLVVYLQPNLVDLFFLPDELYPKEAVVQLDPDYYYRVLKYTLWSKSWVFWTTLQASHALLFLAAGAVASAVALLMMRMRGAGKGRF